MTHLKTKIAEYGIIINKNKEFLMLRFSKETNPSEGWIFPGGRLDVGEKPKQGLLREIKEETKLDVKLGKPCDVSMWGDEDDHRYAIFFLCYLEDEQNIELSKEHQDYNWFTFKELDNIQYHDNSFKDVLKSAKDIL